MNKAITVILPIIVLIIGSIWAYQSFSNLTKGNPELEAEIRETTIQLNAATNTLVDECLKTLPAGSPSCDNMKSTVDEACQTTGNQLDACNDGRVEQYYSFRETGSSMTPTSLSDNVTVSENTTEGTPKTASLKSSDSTVAAVKPSDIRCFTHISGINPTDDDWSFYVVDVFGEFPKEKCERIEEDSANDAYAKDINNRSGWGMRDLMSLLDNEHYTEIKLLNGTTIIVGEKEVKHTRSCDPYGAGSPYDDGC